ncbi:MAG: DNA polymerase/3'-5' exonuclease PolX [Thermacetogeniaceae bacterium]
MTNWEICDIFNEIAELLEILGENPFKARAYRNAARILESVSGDVRELVRDGRIKEIPGIGDALAAKITELVTTGRLNYYEDLKQKVPPDVRQMLKIPGVGEKTVQLFLHNQITSLAELEAAAREGRLRALPGIGKKTESEILRGLVALQQRQKRWLLNVASMAVKEIGSYLADLDKVERVEAAGSFRRGQETVGDLDFVVASSDPPAVIGWFASAPWVREVVAEGDQKATIITVWGLQVDIYVVPPHLFTSTLHHFTGSKEHNVALRERARQHGWKISEYGIVKEETTLYPANEEEFFQMLGLSYIPPELREDRGEIQAAELGELPSLVEAGDIRGDLHVHSKASDGANSLEELAQAAMARGYQYLAVTDHSRSLAFTNGLTEERLLKQREEIDRLNGEFQGFRLLAGSEVEILPDGRLDFDDRVLSQLDLVVASVHSGFRQNQETLNGRFEAVLKNEHVDIIGHPTGRLIGRRDPYDLDVGKVLELAATTGTALEINASPDRLDLNDNYVHQGRGLGVKFAINTDAHQARYLDDAQYGVLTARRGWAQKQDIINTKPLGELHKWLKNHG